jgi:hypothetical protein
VNWYAYCGNNPLLFVDPLGLDAYIPEMGGNQSLPNKTTEEHTAAIAQQRAENPEIRKNELNGAAVTGNETKDTQTKQPVDFGLPPVKPFKPAAEFPKIKYTGNMWLDALINFPNAAINIINTIPQLGNQLATEGKYLVEEGPGNYLAKSGESILNIGADIGIAVYKTGEQIYYNPAEVAKKIYEALNKPEAGEAVLTFGAEAILGAKLAKVMAEGSSLADKAKYLNSAEGVGNATARTTTQTTKGGKGLLKKAEDFLRYNPNIEIPEGTTYYPIDEIGRGWIYTPVYDKAGNLIGGVVPEGAGHIFGGALGDIMKH